MMRNPFRTRVPRLATASALVLALSTCVDATDVELLQIEGAGAIVGQLFLDLDGSGTPTGPDEPLTMAEVVLATRSSSQEIVRATTDTVGAFALFDVAAGAYNLSIDADVLGDSLVSVGATDSITVQPGDTALAVLGASYPTLTLEETVAAAAGRRVFTTGIALSSRDNAGDGQVHFAGETSFLRALDVERGSLSPGDSVRLLGRVTIDNGRPALDDVTFEVLVFGATVATPTEVATADAATADDEALDAALARIRRSEITDTSTVGGAFRFWTDDGSDPVEVVIRDFLVPSFNTTLFRPDTIVRVQSMSGLLSPYDDGTGDVRWRLLPRAPGDVILETKQADISVTTTFDVDDAGLGDTVEAMVVLTNSGPHTATGVQVSDTIPTGVDFLSATATTGSYDDGTGLWDVGDLLAGAADTLRIELEVTLDTPGTVTNVAEFLGLIFQLEPNGTNDQDDADLTIS